jgi:hypothetical protein
VSKDYDFTSHPVLALRVWNLINWWRDQAAESCDDGGSIKIMTDQLERALIGPPRRELGPAVLAVINAEMELDRAFMAARREEGEAE